MFKINRDNAVEKSDKYWFDASQWNLRFMLTILHQMMQENSLFTKIKFVTNSIHCTIYIGSGC